MTLTRFIVRMNQHIHDNCVWRTGVLLKIGENHALVKADYECPGVFAGLLCRRFSWLWHFPQ